MPKEIIKPAISIMIKFSLFEKEDDEDQLIYEEDDWTFEDEEVHKVCNTIAGLKIRARHLLMRHLF